MARPLPKRMPASSSPRSRAAIACAKLGSLRNSRADNRRASGTRRNQGASAAPSRMWRALTARTVSASIASGSGARQRSRAANCEAPANMPPLMSRAMEAGTPLAAAAPPKAMPKGMTNTASGAISMAPRRTPRAVKHGRSGGRVSLSLVSVGVATMFSWQREPVGLSTSGRYERSDLLFDRYPDLDAAGPALRIEGVAVALEVGGVGDLVAGLRQPAVPDRVHGAADRRDVVAVQEHRVALRGDAHAAELGRQVREAGDLDAADVVEIAVLVGVAADP